MATMKEITCKCGCGRKKFVRVADIKRGWGLFYSKSCKASHQEERTGTYRKYLNRQFSGKSSYHGDREDRGIYQEDGIHPIGYGHVFASGDEGHGQE